MSEAFVEELNLSHSSASDVPRKPRQQRNDDSFSKNWRDLECFKCHKVVKIPTNVTQWLSQDLCPICYYKPDHVIDNVYISNYQCAKRLAFLQKYNITNIIVCGSDLRMFFEDNITYLKFDLDDTEDESIAQYFESAIQFINNCNPTNNILIHCYAGISRSATIVLAYLMKSHHMSLTNALTYLISKRDCIAPNPGFMRQLQKYECELLRAASATSADEGGGTNNNYTIYHEPLSTLSDDDETTSLSSALPIPAVEEE